MESRRLYACPCHRYAPCSPRVPYRSIFYFGRGQEAYSHDEYLRRALREPIGTRKLRRRYGPQPRFALINSYINRLDAPINVGWGSKQTQFHGSLGKAAAQAPKPAVVGSSPDDDEIPRIGWRGDGAFFVVSSLSPIPNDETTSHAYEHRRRTLRMYSHTGVLQTTSEPTPGLEHALSWRPSGNWIVTTQRYGFTGGGSGRQGRHDLVMFERNGLRRGDFSLEGGVEPVGKVEGSDRKWGYRVRELGWSADSNILSIWIEKDDADVGTSQADWWATCYLCADSATLDNWKLPLVLEARDPGTRIEWSPRTLHFCFMAPRRYLADYPDY